MIKKQFSTLSHRQKLILIVCPLLIGSLILAIMKPSSMSFFHEESEKVFWLGISLVGFVIFLLILSRIASTVRYNKFCKRVGEHVIDLYEAEYESGQETKEVVFGNEHLFIKAGINPTFDIIDYNDIIWMHLYELSFDIQFIPVYTQRQLILHLDSADRGPSKWVEINVRRIRNKPELDALVNWILDKNPNILLGENKEWQKMLRNNKQALAKLAREQNNNSFFDRLRAHST